MIGAALTAGWAAVANHLWQTTLVLLAIAWLARRLREAPAGVVHGLWLAGLVKLLLPAAWLGVAGSWLFRWWPAGGAAAMAEGPSGRIVQGVLAPLGRGPDPTSSVEAGGTLVWLLTVAWATGVVVLLARSLRSAGGGASRPTPLAACEGADAETLRRAAAGIPPDRILVAEGRFTPRVTGVWRPRLLVPRGLAGRLTPAELRAVLLHESAHVRRRDGLTALAGRVAAIAFFFYPLTWILLRRLRVTAEQACDEAVLAAGVARGDYTRALATAIGFALGAAPPAHAAGLGYGSDLQDRLRRIERPRRCDMRRRRMLAWMTVAWTMTLAVPLAIGAVRGDDDAMARTAGARFERLAGAEREVVLSPGRRDVDALFRELAAETGLEIRVDGPTRECTTVALTPLPLKLLLEELAGRCMLSFDVLSSRRLVVRSPYLAGVEGVTNPRFLTESKVQPVYPERAREAGVEGNVIFEVLILRDGRVGPIGVLRGVPGFPGFEEAALDAIRQWRYEPATFEGEPVDALFTIFIEFKLPNGQRPTPL